MCSSTAMLENSNVIRCLHLYVPTVDIIVINAEFVFVSQIPPVV